MNQIVKIHISHVDKIQFFFPDKDGASLKDQDQNNDHSRQHWIQEGRVRDDGINISEEQRDSKIKKKERKIALEEQILITGYILEVFW